MTARAPRVVTYRERIVRLIVAALAMIVGVGVSPLVAAPPFNGADLLWLICLVAWLVAWWPWIQRGYFGSVVFQPRQPRRRRVGIPE